MNGRSSVLLGLLVGLACSGNRPADEMARLDATAGGPGVVGFGNLDGSPGSFGGGSFGGGGFGGGSFGDAGTPAVDAAPAVDDGGAGGKKGDEGGGGKAGGDGQRDDARPADSPRDSGSDAVTRDGGADALRADGGACLARQSVCQTTQDCCAGLTCRQTDLGLQCR